MDNVKIVKLSSFPTDFRHMLDTASIHCEPPSRHGGIMDKAHPSLSSHPAECEHSTREQGPRQTDGVGLRRRLKSVLS